MWSRERASRERKCKFLCCLSVFLASPYLVLAVNFRTSNRVVWFSMAEAAVMLIMGVWQTLSLRAYFMQEKR